jgi:hypothetical protein|tara:strand:- start:360 stop:470 length:111 start_codon:yes stop_codon:yes gene_type:complete
MSPIYKHTIHKNKAAKPEPKPEPKKAEKKEPKAKKK